MSTAASHVRAYLMLAGTSLCWGANTVFGRLAVGEASPMAVVLFRWLGVVILIALFANKHVRHDWPVLKPKLGFIFLMGALGFAAFNGMFYVAAHSTTALNMGILQGSIPVFVLLGSYVVFRSPVGRLQALGVVVTIVGVVTVATGGRLGQLSGLGVNAGDGLMTLFPSFLAQLFFMHGVEAIGPGRAGVFVNLVPVFSAILAVAILGEPFKFYHAVALVLVLGGIYLSERGKP